MQIIVLGMHRSGTSVVTRLLNMLGGYFGAEGTMTSANAENPKGFWERRDIRAVNDALLHGAGMEWDRVLDFDLANVPADVLARERKTAAEIVLSLDAHRPWVAKEPRFCVTLPFWRPLLEAPLVIHVLRNPVQVALSLRSRNGIPALAGSAMWEAYVLRQFQHAEGLPSMVVNHGDVMVDPMAAVCSMHDWLTEQGVRGLSRPSEQEVSRFIDPNLFRARAVTEEERHIVSPEVMRVWQMACSDDCGDLARQALSQTSRAHLHEYEQQAARLQEASATAQQARKQEQRIGAIEARMAREGEQHREALASIAKGLQELTRTASELAGANGAIHALHARQDEMRKLVETSREDVSLDLSGLRSELKNIGQLLAHPPKLEPDIHQSEQERTRERQHQAAQRADLRRQIEAALLDLERQHERVRADVIRNLRIVDDALRQYECTWSGRLARLISSPMRLFRSGGNAVDGVRHRLRTLQGNLAAFEGRHANVLNVLARFQSNAPVRTVVRRTAASSPRPAARREFTAEERARNQDHLKVLVLAWDIGHNPVGRAYMLAQALATRFDVVLAGPQFPRYGDRIWAPIAQSTVPIVTLPGEDFPQFFAAMERLAGRIEADVIVACKPRLPSLELGLLMKEKLNRPLIVDVDDHELAFFRGAEPIHARHLDAALTTLDPDLPFGELWTRYAETLIAGCDAVFTSNIALQQRFGGALVPHARDFEQFDPSLYLRDQERERLGFQPGDRIVLFLGTIRPHKGVDKVIDAVLQIDDPAVKLCVIGDIPDAGYRTRLLERAGDRVRILPGQSFADLPRNVVIADLVVLLQDPDSPISCYQLPAKVIDAIAMAVPVLATATEPLRPLIERKLVQVISDRPLPQDIADALAGSERQRTRLLARRRAIAADYSYEAIAQTMSGVIVDLLAKTQLQSLSADGKGLLDRHRILFGGEHRLDRPFSGPGLDLVFFWKQNDSTLYGRRIDMLVKHLAVRDEIRSIHVFDAGIDVPQLRRWTKAEALTQYREVAVRTLAKRWGLLDSEKIRYGTFIAAGNGRQSVLRRWPYPRAIEELTYYRTTLEQAGVDPSRAIAFVYPCRDDLPSVLDELRPALTVCDLVDDNRTWDGLTEERLARIEQNYQHVLAMSDIAIANCEAVRDSMSQWHPNIQVLANACELLESDEKAERPADLAGLEGPILGYVGNLEDKLDLELLERLATERPDHQIALIGSAHAYPDVMKLSVHANVHFLGIKPYDEISAYVSAFDVALVPHRDTAKTRSMNPLKLFVYSAHNVPIVTTRVGNLGEIEAFCHVADTHDAFIERVDRALREGRPARTNAMTEVLRRNAWSERIDQILTLIREAQQAHDTPKA